MQDDKQYIAKDTASNDVASIEKIKRWSPIWIIPIVTLLLGGWILFYHFSTQGPLITLVTSSAEGVVGGKTAIKSRSVDIGIVETVTLSDNLQNVLIQARLHRDMEQLLKKDSVFWVVKPQIGREGVSGLSTLLSGAYIELQPGRSDKEARSFMLQDSPPLAAPDAKGLRIFLQSTQSGSLSVGDPILFRGFRVGSVESSEFDSIGRVMRYQLFITAPYDILVTSNVRFWLDSGFAFDISSEGLRLDVASLQTLLSGGVSFDVPEGWPNGESVENGTNFELFSNEADIQDSLFVKHENYILFFKDSIRGLAAGAPVEFRGIRIGTVVQAPYYIPGIWEMRNKQFYIPILIRLEPDRLSSKISGDFEMQKYLLKAEKDGLRASLKSGNLLTGSLFVDFNFYPNAEPWPVTDGKYKYPVLASVSNDLAQIQQKLMTTLDKINALPMDSMVQEVSLTLKESQQMIRSMDKAMASLNQMISSKEAQGLPKELQTSLNELNRTLKGVQPGSPAYSKLVDDMSRLDQVLRELQPVLRTLNEKSNALVFEAAATKDPQPKRAK